MSPAVFGPEAGPAAPGAPAVRGFDGDACIFRLMDGGGAAGLTRFGLVRRWFSGQRSGFRLCLYSTSELERVCVYSF